MILGPSIRNLLQRTCNHLTKKCLPQQSSSIKEGFLSSISRHLTTSSQKSQQKSNPKAQTQLQPKVRLHEKIRDSILILEAKQGPLGKTFVGIGQGLCSFGLVFGSGSLLYYTLFDQGPPKVDDTHGIYTEHVHSTHVPDYAQARVNTAYMYMLNSLAMSTVGAAISFRLFKSASFLHAISGRPLVAVAVTMGCQFLITALVRSLPYNEGFGLKQGASIAQALLIGFAAAPLYLMGAQSIIRAGFVTAGVISGLTAISTIVPHDIFQTWEAPLKLGMYAVFLSFMSLWFISRRHPYYNLLYKMAMHGGLIVFPAYYLYNTKTLVHNAMYSPRFDPINSSMSMYTDVLNIYGRLAFLLPPHYFISATQSNSKK